MEGSILPSQLNLLPSQPGVYFFLNHQKKILYVGKAAVLLKRVSQYFQKGNHNQKTLAMLSQVAAIGYMCTTSAHAALVLENEKIKQYKPKYNILLKDDKTFPYLCLSAHPFPRMSVTRGRYDSNATFLGPFTSVRELRVLLDALQKIFKLRTCTDHYFNHRSRPCLLHQIGRCHAPCVGKIEEKAYQGVAKDLARFVQGQSSEVIDAYVQAMQVASEALDFSKAVYYRDAISAMQQLRAQEAEKLHSEALDVVCASKVHDGTLIQMLWLRDQKLQETKATFIEETVDVEMDVLGQFLQGFYQQALIPFGKPKILMVAGALEDAQERKVLFKTLGIRLVTKPDKFQKMVELCRSNLEASVRKHVQGHQKYLPVFEHLSELFGLDEASKIECVDISHTFGVHTYASCVRLGHSGPLKSEYRTYKLQTGADDYASMREVAKKRYGPLAAKGQLPDVLLIDGGKNQLGAVKKVFDATGELFLPLVAITKDKARKVGNERYFVQKPFDPEVKEVDFPPFVRRAMELIRDEAHRFAISQHRRARSKQALSSPLLEIEGIGPKRHADLLAHFGGLAGLKSATLLQLKQVPGVSQDLAERIDKMLKDL